MYLSQLDKRSEITPILVRLHESQKIYDLASDTDPEARLELAGVMYDLLEMKLSEKESILVADIFIALIRQAKKDLRCVISEHLSSLEGMPLRVALQIANDDIEVAQPVLEYSPVLGDLDLAYIIKSKGPEYWSTIARRKNLSGPVMEMLADTKDIDTALAIIENRHIQLTDETIGILVDIAQGSDVVAQPLILRDEITNDIAADLYSFVGEAIQQQIIAEYEIMVVDMKDTATATATASSAPADISEAVSDVLIDFVDEIEDKSAVFTPDKNHIDGAKDRKIKGLLRIGSIISIFKSGQTKSFIAQFSQFTGVEADVIEEMMMQASGQGLAIISKANGLEKQDFMSIFLLSSRLRNDGGDESVDVSDISSAVNYFDRVDKDMAQEILASTFGGTLIEH